MGATKVVTDKTFEVEVLKNDKPVIVDYWAEWCGPCRMVAPVLEEIATEYADKIDVVKLNIDENPAVSQRYGIMAIPTMNVFSGGQVVKQIVGAKPKSALLRELAEYMSVTASRTRGNPSGFPGLQRLVVHTGRRAPWGVNRVMEPSRRSRATSTSSRQVSAVRSSIRSRG